jgi:metal-responsive CopG/Arc/MetJ family transcriptional regulator
MKTAISIPDTIFNAAENAAKRLGMSRSEFYSKAVADYTRNLQDEDITEKLNEVYSEADSSLDPVLSEMQWRSISREDW